MKSLLVVSALASLAHLTSAQAPLWGQCGGIGWTGATTCVSGACCQAQNPYYSQCLQGNCGGNPVTTTPAVTTTSRAPGTTPGTTTTSASGSGATVRSPGCGRAATISSGTRSITVNGQNRQYIIRVPNNYDSNKPYKLIFSIHWRGGNMQNAASGNNYYGLVPLAGENAIFISPQGFDAGWANNNGQDVTFFDAMIAQVEAGLCVNQRQRFATGFSWGGGMSFSLACSRATVFRAVSVIAGGQISGCSGGNDPIAYLGIHGLRDNVLSISGGRTLRDRFVRNNGCTSQSPPEPAQGSLSHRKTAYSGCRAGYPVVWIASDSGHVSAPADGTTGDGSNTFAPKETWDFFNQFT